MTTPIHTNLIHIEYLVGSDWLMADAHVYSLNIERGYDGRNALLSSYQTGMATVQVQGNWAKAKLLDKVLTVGTKMRIIWRDSQNTKTIYLFTGVLSALDWNAKDKIGRLQIKENWYVMEQIIGVFALGSDCVGGSKTGTGVGAATPSMDTQAWVDHLISHSGLSASPDNVSVAAGTMVDIHMGAPEQASLAELADRIENSSALKIYCTADGKIEVTDLGDPTRHTSVHQRFTNVGDTTFPEFEDSYDSSFRGTAKNMRYIDFDAGWSSENFCNSVTLSNTETRFDYDITDARPLSGTQVQVSAPGHNLQAYSYATIWNTGNATWDGKGGYVAGVDADVVKLNISGMGSAPVISQGSLVGNGMKYRTENEYQCWDATSVATYGLHDKVAKTMLWPLIPRPAGNVEGGSSDTWPSPTGSWVEWWRHYIFGYAKTNPAIDDLRSLTTLDYASEGRVVNVGQIPDIGDLVEFVWDEPDGTGYIGQKRQVCAVSHTITRERWETTLTFFDLVFGYV